MSTIKYSINVNKKKLKKKTYFQIDLEKFYYKNFRKETPSFKQKIMLWFSNFGLHCVAVYRFGQFALNLNSKNKFLGTFFNYIYYFFEHIMLLIHQVQIPRQCKIGPGFYISHVGNIRVGAKSIGENFDITHNVTIGHSFDPIVNKSRPLPKIGDNVWVGTGSIIIGDITIGDRATISCGSVVSRNIPDDCLVGGNPGRVLLREYRNNELLVYNITNNK